MLSTEIFQTLEYRGNETEVVKHGPYFCCARNSDGTMKYGTKEPWLGEGYYFWDTRISDAQWWGETVYKNTGYTICKTTYDQHSPLLYDLLGIAKHFDEFIECAKLIKKQRNLTEIKVAAVLEYLKKYTEFNYKAVRTWPNPKNYKDLGIIFPDQKMILANVDKIQICFFDKTLLAEPFSVIESKRFAGNQTI